MIFNTSARLGLFAALVACTSVLASISPSDDSIFNNPVRFEKRALTADTANPSLHARGFRRHHQVRRGGQANKPCKKGQGQTKRGQNQGGAQGNGQADQGKGQGGAQGKGAQGQGQGGAAGKGQGQGSVAVAAGSGASGEGDASLTLDKNLVQTSSAFNLANVSNGESDIPIHSRDNFINNCIGKTLTNGTQNPNGSCNAVPMGDIPDTDHYPASAILEPKNFGVAAKENQTFNVVLAFKNMPLGVFSDADLQYFDAPQTLDSDGRIVGHTHVWIQQIKNFQDTEVYDILDFVFFLGIKEGVDKNGQITVPITGGLPTGTFRVGTLTTASTHQGVVVGLAKHAAVDLTTYFEIK